MPCEIKVSVTATWKAEEADGSECLNCGDPTYLGCKRLYVQVASYPEEAADMVLCQSCSDALKE